MEQKLNSNDAHIFVNTIHERINNYFAEKNYSIKSNKLMVSKIITGFLWWSLSYIAIFLFASNEIEFLLLYLFHGAGHIFFSFNVGHDALHGAISKKTRINRILAYSYDLLGVNTYMWRYMHHRGHHACLNVEGEDMSLETAGLFRLTNHSERKPFHKYQHIYAFVVYGLFLPYYVFVKDYKYFFSKNNVHLQGVKHSGKEWIKLFIGKFTYLTYMLFFPLYFFPFSWVFILFTFFLTLSLIGLMMSFTFQTTHVIDSTSYPRSKNEYENYVFHVFDTTADYAANNPIANWFFGGLNLHVIHHLRSDICHTHYPPLTKIVKATAKEFGVNYRENTTFYSAIKAHLRELKRLGRAN